MYLAELFTQCGTTLFGDRWKADMATALKVSVDRIDDWSKSRGNAPPQGVWIEIGGLLQEREVAIPKLRSAVNLAAHEAWDEARRRGRRREDQD
jgi:hypothetical protein